MDAVKFDELEISSTYSSSCPIIVKIELLIIFSDPRPFISATLKSAQRIGSSISIRSTSRKSSSGSPLRILTSSKKSDLLVVDTCVQPKVTKNQKDAI